MFFVGALRIGWRWLTTGYLITTHRLVVRRGLMTRMGDESLDLDLLGQRWMREGTLGSWLGYGSVYVVCRGVHHRLRYVPTPERFDAELEAAYREHYPLRAGYI